MPNPAKPQNGPTNRPDESTAQQAASDSDNPTTTTPKWPGWPGDNVFRLIVPVLKVGSIIGRKGELIKKICDETRARVRILDAPTGTPDRVVSKPFTAHLVNLAVCLIRAELRFTFVGEV